jgi:proteasome lid subunit RPN8/RPN11
MSIGLRMTAAQHARLRDHLFPSDGKEAVAIVLCGRCAGGPRQWLVARKIVPIPHEQCPVRTPDRVTWSTEPMLPLLEEAAHRNLAVLKIHSHPTGFPEFSELDDASDLELFDAVHGCVDGELPHASAVMLPGGRVFGRAIHVGGAFEPLHVVCVVGDDVRFWYAEQLEESLPEHARRHAQVFGEGTTAKLRRLRVAVVGCSGTGSPLVEQLARLGVGLLLLVDPDVVEEMNLNRIHGATFEDAQLGRHKVEVLARSVRAIGLGTTVIPLRKDLFDPDVVRLVAGCDVVFGCMDSVEGRHVLNRLATFYLLPYFDLGVRLDADGTGNVDYVGGVVHYLQPGGSSLLSRGQYTLDDVDAEALRRTDPAAYAAQVKSRYIKGVQEDRPAVVSVNTQVAAMAVNELLARVHPFRDEPNAEFAVHRLIISSGDVYREPEGKPCNLLLKHVGRGDVDPLLDLPALSQRTP